ncbi:plasma membrane fusion protein prm1 [Batrachochytrium dendrobatidis]
MVKRSMDRQAAPQLSNPSKPSHIHTRKRQFSHESTNLSSSPTMWAADSSTAYSNEAYNQNSISQHTHLKPYLGRTAKLSRAYANHIVLALALVLCSLIVLSTYISRDANTAKRVLAQACTGLETATNALALTPRFTAIALNRVTTITMHNAIDQVGRLAHAALILVKQLMLYILFRYQRVILCALQLTVMSATNAVSSHAQQITNFLNTQLKDISGTLAAGLNGINSQIQNVDSAISKIPSLPFGGPSIPQIGTVGLSAVSDKLNGLQLPASFQQTLQGLSASIPTLDDIEAKISGVLSGPFDDVSNKISAALANVKVPDQGIFPVMDPIQPIRFCYGNAYNLGWIDRISEAITVALWYGCLGIVLAMMGVTAFYMFWILWEHRLHEQNVARIQTMLKASGRNEPLADLDEITFSRMNTFQHATIDSHFTVCGLIAAVQFPVLTAMLGFIYKDPFRYPTAFQTRLMWSMQYVAHPFSLLCIAFGITGLIVVRFQIYLLRLIVQNIIPLLGQEIIQALDFILGRIASAVDAVVGPFISKVNTDINAIETQVNTVMIGWANDTIATAEVGIETVMTGFNDALNNLFEAVPGIKTAVISFTTCVIGNHTAMLRSIQNSLANGVVISLPRANASDFSIDASKLFMALNVTTQMMNMTTETVQNAPRAIFVDQLTWMQTEYEKTLWLQMLPFWVALILGLSIVIFAIIALIFDAIANAPLQIKRQLQPGSRKM